MLAKTPISSQTSFKGTNPNISPRRCLALLTQCPTRCLTQWLRLSVGLGKAATAAARQAGHVLSDIDRHADQTLLSMCEEVVTCHDTMTPWATTGIKVDRSCHVKNRIQRASHHRLNIFEQCFCSCQRSLKKIYIEETCKVLIERCCNGAGTVLERSWNGLGTAMTQDYRLNSVCRVLWPGEGLHEDEWWQGFTARAKDSTWPEAARQRMPYSSWKLIGLIDDRFSDPSFLDFFDDWIILDHSYILHQVGVSWYGHLRFPPWFWLALETVLLWSCRSVDPWSFTTVIHLLSRKPIAWIRRFLIPWPCMTCLWFSMAWPEPGRAVHDVPISDDVCIIVYYIYIYSPNYLLSYICYICTHRVYTRNCAVFVHGDRSKGPCKDF